MTTHVSTPIVLNDESTWQDKIQLVPDSVSWDDQKENNSNTVTNPFATIDEVSTKKFKKMKSMDKKRKGTTQKKVRKNSGFPLSTGMKLPDSSSFADKLAMIICNGKDTATVKDVLTEFQSKGTYIYLKRFLIYCV